MAMRERMECSAKGGDFVTTFGPGDGGQPMGKCVLPVGSEQGDSGSAEAPDTGGVDTSDAGSTDVGR
jgi:hypothetical protein